MAKMTVIFHGSAASNEEDSYDQLSTASPRGLILNKFRDSNLGPPAHHARG